MRTALVLSFLLLLGAAEAAEKPPSQAVRLSIPVGTGASAIAHRLKKAGLINSTLWFKFRLWNKGAQKELKAGDYLISLDLNSGQIIDLLRSGQALLTKFLVKEGTSGWQLAQMLEKRGLVNRQSFYDLISNTSLAKAWDVPGPSLEGYLFPDTYQIAKGNSAKTIARMMVERFKSKISKSLLAQGRPRLTARKVMTLASVIEKEAAHPDELPKVASVFLNRMKKLKRLESCATVRYALNKYTGPVLFKDLDVKSPYNTYRNFGLPPGPISSPGLKAIEAAVAPEKSEYMFFVVAGDGRHHFSKTFEEHKKAKRRYLKLRRGVVQN